MSIQIFGREKCQETRKALRYFKERRIPFHFIDLASRGMSKGELKRVGAVLGIDNLIDREGRRDEERNLKYLSHSIEEELLNDPLLFRTPVVRNGSLVTVGYMPHIWKEWAVPR